MFKTITINHLFPAEMHVSQHAMSVDIPGHEIFSNLTIKASTAGEISTKFTACNVILPSSLGSCGILIMDFEHVCIHPLPACKDMLQTKYKNTRIMCQMLCWICSKSTIKTPERCKFTLLKSL